MSGCSASTDGTHAAAACCSTPSCDRQSRASPSPTGRCARPDGPDRRRNRHAEHGSYRPAWTWDDPNCLGVLEVLRREVMSGGIKMETPFERYRHNTPTLDLSPSSARCPAETSGLR